MASMTADHTELPGVRSLLTPEGVDLRIRLAPLGDRAIALIIDLSIIVGSLLLLTLCLFSMLSQFNFEAFNLTYIIWMLGFFVLRNFYFTLFEASRRSATPGKRMMGLRVVARDGAALTADSVFARNAMRELELYMPIAFLFSQGEGIEALITLTAIVWCGIFVLFPLFNRDRLRAGDLIAGTWVLKAPKQILLPDLAEQASSGTVLTFTDGQLDQYGVKELQVLEKVLRASQPAAMEAVANQIRTKLSWARRVNETDEMFLNTYYKALRQRLEQRLLFGKRKKDKFDQS
ncbi:MAG: RDD family protein [Micropepsaceae bacterium]